MSCDEIMPRELLHDLNGSSGLLDVPSGAQNAPAAIFAHGGGQTYLAFEHDAAQLTAHGVVTFLLDLPAARQLPDLANPHLIVDVLVSSRAIIEAAVKRLRGLPVVDTGRIAYVGVSYGAWVGVMYAAISARIASYVLIATPPRMSDLLITHPLFSFLRNDVSPDVLASSNGMLRQVDAAEHAVALREREVFLQWALHDELICAEAASELEIRSGPRTVSRRYETAHAAIATAPTARSDRTHWLASRWHLAASELPA